MNAKKEASLSSAFDLHATLSNGLLEKSLKAGRLPAQGVLEPDHFPRLLASIVSADSPIEWSFEPEPVPLATGRRRWWLNAKAAVSCTCERCLMPVGVVLATRRGFEFFATAAQADSMTEASLLEGQPAEAEFAEIDFLSPEDAMSLATLIEDELLLCLPMAPKHASCRPPEHRAQAHGASADTGPDEPDTARPLAGLKDLLKKP